MLTHLVLHGIIVLMQPRPSLALCDSTGVAAPGNISLAYDELLQAVLLEGDEETPGCAADMVKISVIAGRGKYMTI